MGIGFDVWIAETDAGRLSRLTLTRLNNSPVWSVDGRRVTFGSNRSGRFWWELFWKPADGTGSAERLLTESADTLFTTEESLGPRSWSPDGQSLVFSVTTASQNEDIWVMPLDGARTPSPLLNTAFNERAATLSPDGRWLAYSSDESGRDEVYMRAFPDMSAKRLVSRGGGTEPVWAPSGRELFYRAGDKMMAVPVQTEPTLTVGTPQLLFEGRYRSNPGFQSYDVHPDGERFVMIQLPAAESTHLVVVLNWFEELKAKVGN